MSAFLEFHIVQNFAPSNLNRDDTGSPKDAFFGGHRRARVSSQCLKKSVRDYFKTSGLVENNNLGVRTQHLDRVLKDALDGIGVKNTSFFNEFVKLALKKNDADEERITSGSNSKNKLASLLFISATEIEKLIELINVHKGILLNLAEKTKLKQKEIPENFKKELKELLRHSKAVDVALFGRMLADFPKANQDAAFQVAHAISTHRVEREFDYFTAVDDKSTEEETGAGMIGQVEFNSATFYRYAVLDVQKLLVNLQGDKELTLSAVTALTESLVRAIPTGKQNSFAAHNAPEFVGISLRHAAPLSLANAFEKPVTPRVDRELTVQSVEKLADYNNKLSAVYGDDKDRWEVLDLTEGGVWPKGNGKNKAKNLKELASKARELAETVLGV
ncbi:MAG: type I-E CRISPR-associated protein Cas7/Cse4/CasC [Desulfovibrio sp.]|jgi:CRISPR system Cascade subunit CasC|nr:type I-E CRISPR-associated protein Cas7/Cse4/CasC [Desulfovibrio sp.]